VLRCRHNGEGNCTNASADAPCSGGFGTKPLKYLCRGKFAQISPFEKKRGRRNGLSKLLPKKFKLF
jgi:hypothetical protein